MDNVIRNIFKEIQMFFNIVNGLLLTLVVMVVTGILIVKHTEEMSVFEKRAVMMAGVVILTLIAMGGVEVYKTEKAYTAHMQSFEHNMKEIDANLDKIARLLEKNK